jgi:hypothetical protein
MPRSGLICRDDLPFKILVIAKVETVIVEHIGEQRSVNLGQALLDIY